jgi:amidase
MNGRFIHLSIITLIAMLSVSLTIASKAGPFNLLWTQEASIADIHAAIRSKGLTCRQLVQMYLNRIEAYDRSGPRLNAIVVVNSDALPTRSE